ncbi:MAG: single-stranded DNA-binding protein [Bdellovibrionota bacterium]
MSDFNRVFLLGRVGNDLELKRSAQDKPYLKISLATNSFRSGQERTTHWHRVIVFGAQAEACTEFLRKGSLILVEGSLEVRTYTDRDDKKATHVTVIAHRVQFLTPRSQSQRTQGQDESEETAVAMA